MKPQGNAPSGADRVTTSAAKAEFIFPSAARLKACPFKAGDHSSKSV